MNSIRKEFVPSMKEMMAWTGQNHGFFITLIPKGFRNLLANLARDAILASESVYEIRNFLS